MFAIDVRVLRAIRFRWDPVDRRAQNGVSEIGEARVGKRLGKDVCKVVPSLNIRDVDGFVLVLVTNVMEMDVDVLRASASEMG